MKWVCAVDFLLFDFPIWISAGWMDALLLLLQLRNSLSEFGPVVIRLTPSPFFSNSFSSSSSTPLPSHFICRAYVTWEPAHTKHELLHQRWPTITISTEHFNTDNYMGINQKVHVLSIVCSFIRLEFWVGSKNYIHCWAILHMYKTLEDSTLWPGWLHFSFVCEIFF